MFFTALTETVIRKNWRRWKPRMCSYTTKILQVGQKAPQGLGSIVPARREFTPKTAAWEGDNERSG
jgi:hypothetical protein